MGFIIIMIFSALNLFFWCSIWIAIMGDPGFVVGFLCSILFMYTPWAHPKWLTKLVLGA